MTVYVDTSALLRLVLREPGAIEDLRSYDALVSSELIAVESARTIDRLRLQGALTLDEAAVRRRAGVEPGQRTVAGTDRHVGRHPPGNRVNLARTAWGVADAGDT